MGHAFSVSSMLDLERCPRLWAAKRIERVPDAGRAARVGLACHAAAEAITVAVIAGTARRLDEIAREAVLDYAYAHGLASDEMHDALEVMDNATAPGSTIAWHVKPEWEARAEATLWLDAEFRPACGSTEAAYTGRLDRLEWSTRGDGLEVWDWKTSREWMSGADVLGDAQAQWYSFLALAFFPGAVVVTYRRVMLRLGYTATATFVRGGRWEQRIRDRVARGRAVAEAVAATGAEAAAERVGPWCEWCPRIAACSAQRATRALELIGPDEAVPREERARTFLALRAATRRLEAEIRADVAENGPCALGDGTELGMHAKRRAVPKLDRAALMDRLRGLGMDASVERDEFAVGDAEIPAVVDRVLERIVPSRTVRRMYRDELIGSAQAQVFDVRPAKEEA